MSMTIYKTTNLVNGKIYVGKDASNRPTYLGSGHVLRRAITKYGKENFKKEVLERCSSLEELAKKEIEWIARLHSTDRKIGYNLTEGGTGGNTFSLMDPQRKARRKKELTEAARKYVSSPEGKKFLSENTKKTWRRKSHREFMTKMMTGREIKWASKISRSIKEWHKTNPIPEESRKRAAEICRQKMTGKEFKPFSEEVKQKIIRMYQTMGPVLIARHLRDEGYDASSYLVRVALKKAGIYKKWQKGIGNKTEKQASISKRGDKNPMFRHSA